MLSRGLFILFSGGFSFAFLLKQLPLLLTQRHPWLQRIFYLSYFTYVMIQLASVWSFLDNRPLSNFSNVTNFSTLLYTIALVGTLYISAQRVIALYPSTQYCKWVQRLLWPVLALFLITRIIRTVFVFLNNSATNSLANWLQLATLLPILIIRSYFDISSFYALVQIRMANYDFLKIRSTDKAQQAMMQLGINVLIEFTLSIIALVIALMEALAFTGDNLAIMDWMLIAWSIASAFESKALYSAIFEERRTSAAKSSQYDEGSKFTSSKLKSVRAAPDEQ
ncbi:hypothetical protein EDD86DRAFT_278059 [Gorgonomyces haynaldii]|nr:hypothetical protein EDD86DRAFT_278059 [Gorgonomyces haynaldii]